jgi:hypothetical protein
LYQGNAEVRETVAMIGEKWDTARLQSLRLVEFPRRVRSHLNLMCAAIPLLFIIAKNLEVAIPPSEMADSVISVISKAYPIVLEHIAEIKKFGAPGDEARFVLFIVVALGFEAFVFGVTIKRFRELQAPLKMNAEDVLLTLLVFSIVIFVLCFDDTKREPRHFWDFTVDAFGFYYVRQAVALYVVGQGITIIVLLLCQVIRKSAKIS